MRFRDILTTEEFDRAVDICNKIYTCKDLSYNTINERIEELKSHLKSLKSEKPIEEKEEIGVVYKDLFTGKKVEQPKDTLYSPKAVKEMILECQSSLRFMEGIKKRYDKLSSVPSV